jgi:hypothetical protein
MREKINSFQQFLDKFQFRKPVNLQEQEYFYRNLREGLSSTLKAVNEYGFIYGALLRIFFGCRRLGFRISVTQSALILGAAAMLAAVLIAGAVRIGSEILLVDKGISLTQENKISASTKTKEIGISQLEKKTGLIKEQKKINGLSYRLGLETFGNENIEKEKSGLITKRIRFELTRHLGPGAVIGLQEGKRGKKVNLLLTGSVGKLGGLIMISAKVIDVENGKVMYITDENIKSENEIPGACDKISGRLVEKIKNWRK